MSRESASRRGVLAAVVCSGFVLTLPGVFGHLLAAVDRVLFDPAAAQVTNTTETTSFTEHTTFSRVDLAPMEAFETRVVAERDGAVVHDEVVAAPPGPATFDPAVAALAGACSVSGPELVSSSDVPATASLGDEPDHFLETATTERVIGPATIFIGPNRTVEFVVEAGTQNINEAFHTEFFVNQVFQTTVTHRATFRFVGTSCSAPPPVPADVAPEVVENPPAATPVVATPRTAG